MFRQLGIWLQLGIRLQLVIRQLGIRLQLVFRRSWGCGAMAVAHWKRVAEDVAQRRGRTTVQELLTPEMIRATGDSCSVLLVRQALPTETCDDLLAKGCKLWRPCPSRALARRGWA